MSFNSFPQLLLVVENEGVQVCAREALRVYAVEDPANTARGGMMGDCGLSVAPGAGAAPLTTTARLWVLLVARARSAMPKNKPINTRCAR